MDTIFARVGGEPLKIAQKQAAREIPRRMPGLIAAERHESRQTGRKTGQKWRIWYEKRESPRPAVVGNWAGSVTHPHLALRGLRREVEGLKANPTPMRCHRDDARCSASPGMTTPVAPLHAVRLTG